jgi:hypothetical protein
MRLAAEVLVDRQRDLGSQGFSYVPNEALEAVLDDMGATAIDRLQR